MNTTPLLMDTATTYSRHHIEAARSVLTQDALHILGPGPVRSIVEAVDADLCAALEWRIANMSAVDEAADRHEAQLERAETVTHYVDVVRASLATFGPRWRSAVPQAAWTARRYVHLSILEAEHNPAAMARALDRIYGPEGVTA